MTAIKETILMTVVCAGWVVTVWRWWKSGRCWCGRYDGFHGPLTAVHTGTTTHTPGGCW